MVVILLYVGNDLDKQRVCFKFHFELLKTAM